MTTQLSNLGFTGAEGSDLETLARKCFQNGRATRGKNGTYICWALGNGIEIWIQLSLTEELLGLNPHFMGKTRDSVGLMQRISRTGFPMDGGFLALAQPYGSDPIRGAFRFVFDSPDFLVHEEMKLPRIATVQLTAFAQQCAFVDSDKEFASLAARQGTSVTSESLIALGFSGKNREPLAEPLASAMVCGLILDSQQITNPMTKVPFWWLRIRNAAGEIDVVAANDMVSRPPKLGGILQCSAWLSGRVTG
ncbi:MAG TPA: hypothetical protein VEK08_20530 [Planctomycetota bacterium]|nr:hypothetical protein [Planctomycetota bacterium]